MTTTTTVVHFTSHKSLPCSSPQRLQCRPQQQQQQQQLLLQQQATIPYLHSSRTKSNDLRCQSTRKRAHFPAIAAAVTTTTTTKSITNEAGTNNFQLVVIKDVENRCLLLGHSLLVCDTRATACTRTHTHAHIHVHSSTHTHGRLCGHHLLHRASDRQIYR